MINRLFGRILNSKYNGVYRLIPDKLYLKMLSKVRLNRKLDLKNPKAFNDKLQWLKLYDRNPEYTKFVDKYEVREYISNIIGEEYLIPLIGVYDTFDEINFDELPEHFVLKCTHDSGGTFICSDKSDLDIPRVKEKFERLLKRNYYYSKREWPYKNIKPKIIAEKYMVDESGTELKDYKYFCFNGEVKAMFIATDRGIDTRFDFFDLNFNHMSFMQHYLNADKSIKKPKGFEEMKGLARVLSKGIPHVRVDFYDIDGKIYFGEMTFSHFSGFEKFEPESYDYLFGSWLELPKR